MCNKLFDSKLGALTNAMLWFLMQQQDYGWGTGLENARALGYKEVVLLHLGICCVVMKAPLAYHVTTICVSW